MHIRAGFKRLVDVRLQRDGLAAADALVGGNDGLAVRVEDAVLDGFRGEAAEYNRVNGADAGARQHGIDRLRHHRHVDTHPVALADIARLQCIGQPAHVFVQLAIADVGVIGRVVALPDQRGLFRTPLQVAVDAVVARVQLAAFEPADVCRAVVPLQHLVPGFFPGDELVCLLGPETFRVFHRLPVQFLGLLLVDVGLAGKRLGYLVHLDFGHAVLRCWSCRGRQVVDYSLPCLGTGNRFILGAVFRAGTVAVR